ncbi:MAG TPA: GntR family transcriptional regulator [Chloroflexota bacterium]|nr:GntR family transcriptional regulator [Chloroflexota bacterium]
MTSRIESGVLEAPRFRLLSQQIAFTLRRAILHGRYRPGERLVEAEVAAALDVSRAPVRDALRQLVSEGLASAYPHRGAVVTPVSEDMVHDVFDVRARLEGLAATRVTADELGRLEALIGAMEQSARSNEPGPQVEQDLEFHRTILAARRAARPSSRARTSKTSCTMSSDTGVTTAPRWG